MKQSDWNEILGEFVRPYAGKLLLNMVALKEFLIQVKNKDGSPLLSPEQIKEGLRRARIMNEELRK